MGQCLLEMLQRPAAPRVGQGEKAFIAASGTQTCGLNYWSPGMPYMW